MKLIGLLLSVVFVAVLIVVAMRRPSTPASDAPAGGELGAAPPPDFGKNAGSTKDTMRRQVCLAECASENRACKTIGIEPSAITACDEKKSDCEARCR